MSDSNGAIAVVSSVVISKSIDLAKPIVETGCHLLKEMLGEPCKVAGGMLSDQIYGWQWRNRLKIANRTARLLKDRRIDPRVMPPGFLMPLLESAGNCDDPDIAELWARLWAGAVTDEHARHVIFVDVLRRMSSPEAVYFARLCETETERGSRRVGPPIPHDDDGSTEIGLLEALGLVKRHEGKPAGIAFSISPAVISITAFGHEFARVVGLGETNVSATQPSAPLHE